MNNQKYLLIIIYLALLIALTLLSNFITFLFCGFDLGDEGYHLSNIVNPWLYNNSATQFGFIYYYLFDILNFNISYLRIANFFIIFLCSYFFSNLFCKIFFYDALLSNLFLLKVLFFIFSVLSLNIYIFWMPTPSYYSLNYIGLMIIMIGIFLIDLSILPRKNPINQSLAGWGLIGFGGYFVFIARPQSGVGLALLVLLWGFVSKRLTLKGLALAVFIALGLLLVTSQLLDGSVSEFIMRYKRALALEKISKIHSPGQLLIIMPDFLKRVFWPQAFFFIVALLCWGAALAHFSNHPNKNLWLIFVIASALAIAAWLHFFPFTLSFIYHKGILLGLSPAGLALHDRLKGISSERARFGQALLLFSMSFLYSLGSNLPTIMGLSISSFLIFSGFVILAIKPGPNSLFRLTGLVLISMVILALLIVETWRKPYNQQTPLWAADIPVEVPENGGKLMMPSYQAEFFKSMYKILRRADFQPGTLVIDLTGKHPGITYAMGGHLPNAAWVNSGYKGSRQAFAFALSQLTCTQLASAWVIMLDSPSSIHYDPDILAEAGLEYQDHYQLAGTARLPVKDVDNEFTFAELLFLKPLASWPERTKSCMVKKGTRG
jgi:hypothetical protein